MLGEFLYFRGVRIGDVGFAFLGRIGFGGVKELFKLRIRIRLGCRHDDVEYKAVLRIWQKKEGTGFPDTLD
jgi:hypothetical protein